MYYATKKDESEEYCDSCEYLEFQSDPDPIDWFHDMDQKAICNKLDAKIAGALEPREMTKISRPLFCPKSTSKLSEKEKEITGKMLILARKYK